MRSRTGATDDHSTMAREGSLEAPTRHPIDWRAPDFYDAGKLDQELHRVFDICHGCRRCVGLCTVPDALRPRRRGRRRARRRRHEDYTKVVDQCYLCDLCYMTKCPPSRRTSGTSTSRT